ncbi:MAG: GntR family transcriptional regulator [Paracoccaceae bacterium]
MSTQLDSTAQAIREHLLAGEYGSSGKLREQNLSQDFGVSRTVIRLALGQLELEGLVTREPNKGFRIRSFTLDEVTDAILVRGELEGMAARLCAQHGLSEVEQEGLRDILRKLDALLAQGIESLASRMAWIDLNDAFHARLIDFSRNASLSETIASLSGMPLVATSATVFDPKGLGPTLARLIAAQQDHHLVLEAICSRESDRAGYIMREHARKSAENKKLGFDAMQRTQHVPALPGLALVTG